MMKEVGMCQILWKPQTYNDDAHGHTLSQLQFFVKLPLCLYTYVESCLKKFACFKCMLGVSVVVEYYYKQQAVNKFPPSPRQVHFHGDYLGNEVTIEGCFLLVGPWQ
jgi:hypothetical protein